MTEQYQGILSAQFRARLTSESLAASPPSRSVQTILAALVDSVSGASPDNSLEHRLRQGMGFRQALNSSFESPGNLPPNFLRELASISGETDFELFFESVLRLGQHYRQERPELALACFSVVQESLTEEFPGRPQNYRALIERAQRQSDAIQGRGEIGARIEYLAGNFMREATSPIGIASMAAGSFAFSVVRTGMMARLVSGSAGYFTRGFGARALASTVAFGVELPAFVLSGRALHEVGGQAQDWSLRAIGRDFATAGITLGLLKLGGAGATTATRHWAQGSGLFPQATRTLLPQAAMFTGILAGHRIEQAFGLREHVDGATTITDALSTLFQFHVAGRLMESAMGPRYAALQRELHSRSEMLASTPRPSRPSGFGDLGLGHDLALAGSGPRHGRIDLFGEQTVWMANNSNEGKPPAAPPSLPTRSGRIEPTEGGGPPRNPTQPVPVRKSLRDQATASQNDGSVPQIIPGTRLGGADGRYEVLRVLGEGGAGRVWLVKDNKEVAGTRSERLAVIKVPTGRTDIARRNRIVREIRITENLASGWAAPIYDVFEWPAGSGVWIPVMEYVDGHIFTDILQAAVQGKPLAEQFPVHRRMDLFAELCLAVHDANNHGIVHGDLKPDNVRVDRNGRMRVLDWGAAKHFTQSVEGPESPRDPAEVLASNSGVNGTPGYVAPEVVFNNLQGNPRTRDIFALGVVLYETATGMHPFGTYRAGDPSRNEPNLVPEWIKSPETWYHPIPQNVALLLTNAEGMQPKPFRDILAGEISPYLVEIEQIARKAMSYDPADRYQSASELREAVLMARAKADRASLNDLQTRRAELEAAITEAWDWREFNVVSRTNPALWAEGEGTLHRLRAMRDEWREGSNDLVIRLTEATRQEPIAEARRMIAELSWERWEEGGDRMSPGERDRLERRIRDNDFEIAPGRKFSEVLTGTAAVRLNIRSSDPEIDANPRVRVIPWSREVDRQGRETGNFQPGEPLFEGVYSEVQSLLNLPAGYYSFEIYEPGFAKTNIPVHVSHRSVHQAVTAQRNLDVAVDLVPVQSLPSHMVLVQGGTSYTGLDFYRDGMPSNVYSFPMRRMQMPTFAIARDLVTVREYSHFIIDLLKRGQIAKALECMPRKGGVPIRGAITPADIQRVFQEEEASGSRIFYWKISVTFDAENGFHYRLIEPTSHKDPNGDPIFAEQPVSAISPDSAQAYVEWRSARDGFRYRLVTANEKEKVDRQSFPWTYPWGYESSPFAGILRLTFQGDLNQTAFPQPLGRHPMGQEFYRDFTIYGTRDNIGNVRELTSSEGEPGTVVLSGGSVRVPYGPFLIPAGRNYPLLRTQVADSIGGIRMAMDVDQASPSP